MHRLAMLLCLCAGCAFAASLPPGWSEQRHGSLLAYVREGLPNGQGLLVIAQELQTTPASQLSSFAASADQIAASLGQVQQRGSAQRRGDAIQRSDQVLHAQFGKLLVLHSGAIGGDGRLKLFHTVMSADPALLRTQQAAIGSLIAALMADSGPLPRPPAPKPSSPTPTPTPTAPDFAFRASPGRGVANDAIAGVAHEGYGRIGPMGGYQWVENTWLLFKDGLLYDGDLPVGPADFDAQASRRAEPQRWRRYELRGSQLKFQDDDGDWVSKDVTVHQALPPGHRLSGVYEHRSAYSMGGLGATTSHTLIRFAPDGSFESSDFTLNTTGVIQQSSGFDSYSSRAEQQPGRYELDGYTLRLHYPDGSTRSKLFFVRGSDKLCVGGVTYSRVKEQP